MGSTVYIHAYIKQSLTITRMDFKQISSLAYHSTVGIWVWLEILIQLLYKHDKNVMISYYTNLYS